MASPGEVLPLEYHDKHFEALSEPENKCREENEQVGEQRLSAQHSSTAVSSTGSTPMPASTLVLAEKKVNTSKEALVASQKPPKIAPRGIRRIRPLREKQGVFIQPWEFNFELLSELKLGHGKKGGKQGTKQPLSGKTQKKAPAASRKPHSASSALATVTCDDYASSSSEVESSSIENVLAASQHRGQHAKLHTTRVEFLLKKYLKDPSEVLNKDQKHEAELGQAGVAEHGVVDTAATSAPRLKKRPETFNKRATKSIMQVKSEQDAAVRALQHAPRQFYATPIPLEVAAPCLNKPCVETVLSSTERKSVDTSVSINLSPRGSQISRAKPVPQSTTEPRYALLVADSVLRRYSADNQSTEEKTAGSEPIIGLQKFTSCPAGLEIQNESAVHLQTAVEIGGTSPQRPQSACSRRRSQSPVGNTNQLPDIAEEGPEQLKEFY